MWFNFIEGLAELEHADSAFQGLQTVLQQRLRFIFQEVTGNSVRVPREYSDKSIHAHTTVPFVFHAPTIISFVSKRTR